MAKAKKKQEAPKVPVIVEPEAKTTTQARIELPSAEFERVRAAARSIGLSVSAFLRMAALKETRRIEDGRD